ncbi:MAG: lysylphosphatidylglycerol synthase transmembrane domain-containing protein [Acidihalobacter sp.]
MKRYLAIAALSLLLSVAIPLVYGGSDVLPQLIRVSPWLIIGTLCMILLGWCFNAARLRLLLGGVAHAIPRRRALATVIATEFAGVASPAGVGGPLTYVYLLHRQGLSTAHAASLYAIDQITDLTFFATALPLALAVFTFDQRLEHPLLLATLLLVLLGTGLGLLWGLMRRYRGMLRLFGRILRPLRVSERRRRKMARWIIQFRHGIALLLSMPRHRLILLYGFCMGHWLMRYSVLPVILLGLGHAVPWSYLFIIQGMLLFAGQLSFLPGGTGSVEVGFAALLAPWLAPEPLALALVLWRFTTFYWYLLAGAPVFLTSAGGATRRLLLARNKP